MKLSYEGVSNQNLLMWTSRLRVAAVAVVADVDEEVDEVMLCCELFRLSIGFELLNVSSVRVPLSPLLSLPLLSFAFSL